MNPAVFLLQQQVSRDVHQRLTQDGLVHSRPNYNKPSVPWRVKDDEVVDVDDNTIHYRMAEQEAKNILQFQQSLMNGAAENRKWWKRLILGE